MSHDTPQSGRPLTEAPDIEADLPRQYEEAGQIVERLPSAEADRRAEGVSEDRRLADAALADLAFNMAGDMTKGEHSMQDAVTLIEGLATRLAALSTRPADADKGVDAGLKAAWRALEKELPDSVHDGYEDQIERVAASVRSAAAALEAAAEREVELVERIGRLGEIGIRQVNELCRAEAQVADRDKRIAELEAALEPFAKQDVLEPNGVIVGLERFHFDRARQALSAIPGRE